MLIASTAIWTVSSPRLFADIGHSYHSSVKLIEIPLLQMLPCTRLCLLLSLLEPPRWYGYPEWKAGWSKVSREKMLVFLIHACE